MSLTCISSHRRAAGWIKARTQEPTYCRQDSMNTEGPLNIQTKNKQKWCCNWSSFQMFLKQNNVRHHNMFTIYFSSQTLQQQQNIVWSSNVFRKYLRVSMFECLVVIWYLNGWMTNKTSISHAVKVTLMLNSIQARGNHQCCHFSRNIAAVTLKIAYFYFQKIYLLDLSIQK